ncbi:S41 family peptidase [Pseudoduganella violaceinigra]|uniref:S41 family peptidase n=1 Tax=Pseudoduganella violaceinigra TaxID=246602 RepID=UPI0004259419|nr:S41 family peptidase [Pseudoduganella violaceinigra]
MKKTTIALLISLFAADAAHAATGTDWSAKAATDLEAARTAIRAGHPGYIDEQNPAFLEWEAKGYAAARALLPRVNSYESMLAAVRTYTAGFQDGHLSYSDDIGNDTLTMGGWRLDYVNSAYRVGAVMPDWGKPLPPVGAELLACDGLRPEQRLRQVAKYYDGRDLPGIHHALATIFTQLDMPGEEMKRCTFRTANGREVQFAQHYKEVKAADFRAMMKSRPRPQHFNTYSLQDGVLWIRAGNFDPDHEASQQLDRMVRELPQLEGVRTIVFDSRGNGGGNSAVGVRIFDAATGGLEFEQDKLDQVPRTFAQWRVSELSIKGMEERLEKFKASYGPDSDDAKRAATVRDKLLQARAAGQPWVEQPGRPRLSRADIAARNGKLRRFNGNVVLVTDEDCVSSCLNFADLVRSVPGAIHMGQATSADTAYIDVTFVSLPSGNHLMLPMKVWRNDLRGNNEVLQPDVPLQVNIRDNAAVRQAVLAALPR